MKKKRLMILDGSSLLYRGFYALPLLSTKDGVYTNGVYGFLTMLYKILDEYKPEYLCVAFDKKAPTFRHIEYKLYKANRQKAPDELNIQFPILQKILDTMNIYQIALEGYEADDIAGTVSKFGEENDLEVILVSGDKDYLQLATDNAKVLMTKKGITQLEEYDKGKIIQKYGITPQQYIDLKGLMGDKSDNIPGVPGIGKKTGIKLLKEFGSIKNIYDNIDKVSGKKTKQTLIDYKQKAIMSKKLAQIITNIPLKLELKELKVEEPNWDELKKLYERFEFKRLLNAIPSDKIEKNSFSDYKVLCDIIDKSNFISLSKKIEQSKKMAFKFVFDGENFLKDEILGIALKVEDNNCYYVDFEQDKLSIEKFVHIFKQYFEREDVEKLGHNIKADIIGLFRLNIQISNVSFDSMIGQYLINPSQTNYDISELSKEHLNINIESEERIRGKGKNKKNYREIELSKRIEHFSKIVDIIFKLENPIKGLIESLNMSELYYKIELPLIEVLASMEFIGFKVNMEKLKELGNKFDNIIQNLTSEIYEIAGKEFNINSPKQLGEILFDRLELPVIKKTKTGYSTSAEVLEKLNGKHPIIEKILSYRQIVKLKTTYIDGLMNVVDENDSRIHSSFNQTITTTGRISSTEPNLQNIPVKTNEGREIRKAFVAQEDYILVDGDYSQIELRVLGHISDDTKLKEAFYDGEDIHSKTASKVFKVLEDKVTPLMRSRAKAVNFGIVYGISEYGLSKDLNISRKEAKEYINNYLSNYEMVKHYMDNIIKQAKKKGYVETILNRRRYLPELKSRNFAVRSFGERVAMNAPIQGSAADIIKIAMVKVYKELKKQKLKSRLILQVHDELIIETYQNEASKVEEIMRNIMENCIKLNVPLKVDIKMGESWYETK